MSKPPPRTRVAVFIPLLLFSLFSLGAMFAPVLPKPQPAELFHGLDIPFETRAGQKSEWQEDLQRQFDVYRAVSISA